MNLICSQCRDCKIGVIWSYFLDLVRTLAAAFLLSVACLLKMQDNHLAVHYNSPVWRSLMNARSSFFASETVNIFRSLAMFLRWKNVVFITWEIWFSKDRLLSNITPRFLTVEEVTVLPSSCKLWSKRFCVLFLGPISNISVLSEFNRRKLLVIQSFTFLTHSVIIDSLEV